MYLKKNYDLWYNHISIFKERSSVIKWKGKPQAEFVDHAMRLQFQSTLYEK